MKQGYSSCEMPQPEGQDQARRLHRAISDNARRLDDARGCARSAADLFAPALLAQRSRLRESCERLIFLDPVLYGRKGEELLWRKVFYDVVSTAKRLGQRVYSAAELAHLQCHINAGIGYYHHLVARLQLELGAGLPPGSVDFPVSTGEPIGALKQGVATEAVRTWAELCVHRCLVYLGDLSRYALDVRPAWDHGLAARYYLQASALRPEYGVPHNQLGTLASGLGRPLDAAYHYMRCLGCAHVFEGTENNLLRLFERNAHVVERMPTDESTREPAEHVGHLVARFLLLVDILYFEKSGAHVHSLCHQVLLDFQACLGYPPPVAEQDAADSAAEEETEPPPPPAFLSPDAVFKMVIVGVLCVLRLQRTNSRQLSALKAFLLAVYSQLVQRVIEHVQGSVLNVCRADAQQNGDGRQGKRSVSRGRRRKRQAHASDDESELSDESEVSFASSTGSEGRSDAATSSSGDESDDADKDRAQNGSDAVNGDTTTTTTGSQDTTNETDQPEDQAKRLDPMDLLEIVAEEGLLPSVKVLSDWLAGDMAVLRECGTSSQILLRKVVQLLNLLHIDGHARLPLAAGHRDHERVPLPEDVILKGVPILRTVHDKLDWTRANSYLAEPRAEALVRVTKLVAFGGFLGDIPETGISYDRRRKRFAISEVVAPPQPDPPSENSTVDESTAKPKEPISRGKLMKDMGQLWLAAEVQDLESRVQGRPAFSPYLVLDVDALIHHTHLAKQFVAARKFIVLVPVIVLSALDELKRETIKAREAIRWLETQFHRGNRFLRAQRPQERAPVPLIKYPKKKDRDTHTFIQIIECCHFLAQQQRGASNLVTLLTGSPTALGSAEARELSRVGLAQSAGVNLELITAFHMKWRKSVKGHR